MTDGRVGGGRFVRNWEGRKQERRCMAVDQVVTARGEYSVDGEEAKQLVMKRHRVLLAYLIIGGYCELGYDATH